MNTNPVHFDVPCAESTPVGLILVDSALTLATPEPAADWTV
jgi:acyl dehydratase